MSRYIISYIILFWSWSCAGQSVLSLSTFADNTIYDNPEKRRLSFAVHTPLKWKRDNLFINLEYNERLSDGDNFRSSLQLAAGAFVNKAYLDTLVFSSPRYSTSNAYFLRSVYEFKRQKNEKSILVRPLVGIVVYPKQNNRLKLNPQLSVAASVKSFTLGLDIEYNKPTSKVYRNEKGYQDHFLSDTARYEYYEVKSISRYHLFGSLLVFRKKAANIKLGVGVSHSLYDNYSRYFNRYNATTMLEARLKKFHLLYGAEYGKVLLTNKLASLEQHVRFGTTFGKAEVALSYCYHSNVNLAWSFEQAGAELRYRFN